MSSTTSTRTTVSSLSRIDWPLVTFFTLAYLLAWGLWLWLAAIARDAGVADTETLLRLAEAGQLATVDLPVPAWIPSLITRLQDFAFSLAGVLLIALTAGRAGLRQLGRRLLRWSFAPRWYLLALLPLLLYTVAAIVAGATPVFTSATLPTILFSAEAGLLVSLFLRGAMGEELGLRGFALPRLQARMSPFRASLIIGLFWGLWHLPVLLGRDPVSLVAFLLLSFGLSFIFTLLFNGSGGSLIPGLLFHATQNREEVFEVLFPALAGTDWELVSTLALLLISLVAAFLVWRGGATRPEDAPASPEQEWSAS